MNDQSRITTSRDRIARSFKSGNSVALRLPAAMGIGPGREFRIREEDGRFMLEPIEAPVRKIDVSKFVGTAPGLKPLEPADRLLDESPRDWHLLDRLNDKT
jgi:antitoxin VapB